MKIPFDVFDGFTTGPQLVPVCLYIVPLFGLLNKSVRDVDDEIPSHGDKVL